MTANHPSEKRQKAGWQDIILLLMVAASVVWLVMKVKVNLQYNWNWGIIPQYLFLRDPQSGALIPGLIMQGLLVTIRVSLWASVLALIIGTIMGLFRVSTGRFQRFVSWAYVELIRNMPILVWVFIVYYFLSDQLFQLMGLEARLLQSSSTTLAATALLFGDPERLPSFLAGVVALALYEGAYITEIVRAGIQSVDKGQGEAALAVGLSPFKRMRLVIMPQAIPRILPPLAGQLISTIKDSSIISVISIQELTFQGMELMAATLITFEVWIVVMLLYLILCLGCSLIVAALEERLGRKFIQSPASA
ncbi:MAG: amino acid ABC transporter permease [Desulfobacterales bacterium]|nr:amino acid ABC transporter permease [Desulfobacterales bacterium]